MSRTRSAAATNLPPADRALDVTRAAVRALLNTLAGRCARLLARENDRLRAECEHLRAMTSYQSVMAHQIVMAGFRDLDPEFEAIYAAVKTFTMTSIERLYALYKAVEYVAKSRVPGDLLECGAWRGGSMMLVAHTLKALGDRQRRIYLFDTFEGHPKPDAEFDVDLWGNPAIADWRKYRRSDETSGWAYVSIDEVRANMVSTGYPMDNVVLVKGMVERTAATSTPERLALLRLDTDWYESTRVALDVMYPRLSDNGVLIADDYGHYLGQRKALDEYFEQAATFPLLTRIDYGCRLAIKPTSTKP